jgi:hypothetical protein
VKNGGELAKYPNMGFYLACGKWHGTMPSWGMKWEYIYIYYAVNRRDVYNADC